MPNAHLKLHVDAEDALSSVTKVEMVVDGESAASMPGVQALTQPCAKECSLNADLDFDPTLLNGEPLEEGPHEVKVVATDGVGLTTESEKITVIVDWTAPELDLSGPAYERDSSTGEVLDGDLYELYVDAEDGEEQSPAAGVESLQVYINDSAVPAHREDEACVDDSCDLDTVFELTPYDFPEGTTTVRLRVDARDASQNTASTSWTVTIGRATEPVDPTLAARQQREEDLSRGGRGARSPDPLGVPVLGGAFPGCREWQPEIDGGLTALEIERIVSKDRETTVVFRNGDYRVSRCDPDGEVMVSMLVGEIDVPAAVPGQTTTARVPLEIADAGLEDEIVVSTPQYGNPLAPGWAALWALHGAETTAMTLPETTLP